MPINQNYYAQYLTKAYEKLLHVGVNSIPNYKQNPLQKEWNYVLF